MLCLCWEYLLGRLVATDTTDRELPEWPPHPDRVFQALVAAWGETGCSASQRAALEWLESLPAPEIRFSSPFAAGPTKSPKYFVPVNDESTNKSGTVLDRLSIKRSRKERFFPRVPVDGGCYLVWEDAREEDVQRHLSALKSLCLATTSIGHSSSLVWIRALQHLPDEELERYRSAAGSGEHRLRVPGKGRLSQLVAAYGDGRERWERPPTAGYESYERVTSDGQPAVERTVFSDRLVVLRCIGPNARRFGAAQVPLLADVLRRTLMAKADSDPRALELISGHPAGGAGRLESPHCAFIGLPFVGREHADGHLLGLAMVLPRGLSLVEEDACLRALALALNDDQQLRLFLESGLSLDLEVVDPAERRMTLQAETWCREPASSGRIEWATVTPIVLDRMPPRRCPDIDEFVAEEIRGACARVGLPHPQSISLSDSSFHRGAPHCRQFPAMKRKNGGGQRWHTHAKLTFDKPIVGPVLLGAGRYRGMGLLKPFDKDQKRSRS